MNFPSQVEGAILLRILASELKMSITSLELKALIVIGEKKGVDEKGLASSLEVDEGLAKHILKRLTDSGFLVRTDTYHLTGIGKTVLEKVKEHLPEVRRAVEGDVYFSSLEDLVGRG